MTQIIKLAFLEIESNDAIESSPWYAKAGAIEIQPLFEHQKLTYLSNT
jgi:hypothetical protein